MRIVPHILGTGPFPGIFKCVSEVAEAHNCTMDFVRMNELHKALHTDKTYHLIILDSALPGMHPIPTIKEYIVNLKSFPNLMDVELLLIRPAWDNVGRELYEAGLVKSISLREITVEGDGGLGTILRRLDQSLNTWAAA